MVFFVLLSMATVFSIADTEADQPVSTAPADLIRTKAENITLTNSFAKRQPSSVAEIKNELISVNLFCDDQAQQQQKSSKDQLVMLNLNVCEDSKATKSISITNVTNGFKAQIFKMSAKNYRTDFIQLSKGVNILTIESVLKDEQKRVQTLEILSGS